MKQFNIRAIALAMGVACSAGAVAQGMSQTDYETGQSRIAEQYQSAMVGCTSYSGNASDICIAVAKGSQKVATAELEVSFNSTPKTVYDARIARADADYAVAQERCDDAAGNAKDVCLKQATAARTTATADAEARMKITAADAAADQKSAMAHGEADEKAADANADAAKATREARLAVAKEKCDIYTASAKDVCLERAETQYGNP